MKKDSKSSQRSEPTMKRTKARGPVQRDAKEVLAEVLEKLTGKHVDRKPKIVFAECCDTHKAELPGVIHSRQSNEQAVNSSENDAASQV